PRRAFLYVEPSSRGHTRCLERRTVRRTRGRWRKMGRSTDQAQLPLRLTVMTATRTHGTERSSTRDSVQILKSSYEFPPLGGGGAKVVMGIARRLAARGHHVDVVTMAYRGLAARDVVSGVHVCRIPGMRLRLSTCSFIEMIPYVLLAPWRIIRLAR